VEEGRNEGINLSNPTIISQGLCVRHVLQRT